MLEWLIKKTEQAIEEGEVVRRAPGLFACAACVVGVLVYVVVNKMFESEIAGFKSAIVSLENIVKLKQDQLESIRNKLGASTQDEAIARIDNLEKKLNLIYPRTLSNENREQMLLLLRGTYGQIDIQQDVASADAKSLAADLSNVFQDAGWSVSLPILFGIGNPPQSGIRLLVRDPDSLSPAERVVRLSLQKIGFDFDVRRRQADGSTANVTILLTTKTR